MVTLKDPQAEFLKREAEKLGITVSDLIRRIIGSPGPEGKHDALSAAAH